MFIEQNGLNIYNLSAVSRNFMIAMFSALMLKLLSKQGLFGVLKMALRWWKEIRVVFRFNISFFKNYLLRCIITPSRWFDLQSRVEYFDEVSLEIKLVFTVIFFKMVTFITSIFSLSLVMRIKKPKMYLCLKLHSLNSCSCELHEI